MNTNQPQGIQAVWTKRHNAARDTPPELPLGWIRPKTGKKLLVFMQELLLPARVLLSVSVTNLVPAWFSDQTASDSIVLSLVLLSCMSQLHLGSQRHLEITNEN